MLTATAETIQAIDQFAIRVASDALRLFHATAPLASIDHHLRDRSICGISQP